MIMFQIACLATALIFLGAAIADLCIQYVLNK